MKLDAGTIRSIEKLLSAELVEYDKYLKLLEQEQKPLGDDVSVQIPAVDEGKFVSRLTVMHQGHQVAVQGRLGRDEELGEP